MKYVARIDWTPDDYTERWNEMLARCVEVFGLPNDRRYVTYVNADYMDFIFNDEQDRLMFLTAWPAHIPESTPYLLPRTKNMQTDQLKVWSAISSQPATYYVNATEEERQIWREWIQSVLREREVTVDFEKATGELRSMKCTLREDLGAKYSVTENKKPRKPNPDVCVVWDTTQQAWRSFRWDRMKKIEFHLG